MTTYSFQCPQKFHAPVFGLSIQSNFPPDVLQIKCDLALYVLQRYASSQWSKCCGLNGRTRVSRQQILINVITHTTVYKNTHSTRWVHLNLHLYTTNPSFILFQSYNAYYYLCSLGKKRNILHDHSCPPLRSSQILRFWLLAMKNVTLSRRFLLIQR